MSENAADGPAYLAGGTSPISGVVHLFDGEQDAGGGAARSLCGAVNSYGPFDPASEADGEVCKNCERVREQRETSEK